MNGAYMKWAPVKKYEGLYEVSEGGHIRSIERKVRWKRGYTSIASRVLINSSQSAKYKTVTLCRDGKRKTVLVHRIVAEAFLPKPKVSWEINHKDGDKENNKALNLEWLPHNENLRHAYRLGLIHSGKKSSRAHPVEQFSFNGKNSIAKYVTILEAERKSSVGRCNISRCCTANKLRKVGRISRAGGYVWRYQEGTQNYA